MLDMLNTELIFDPFYVLNTMKTISIHENTHEQLLKIGGELQRKTGKKVELNDTIQALIQNWNKSPKP